MCLFWCYAMNTHDVLAATQFCFQVHTCWIVTFFVKTQTCKREYASAVEGNGVRVKSVVTLREADMSPQQQQKYVNIRVNTSPWPDKQTKFIHKYIL